ncbi:MAG: FAD-dependent oxidoreductase [Phycisphaeraceae bacterium]|nr:FAD-dependent oxidoreductase [Phycisphaeraceae bacterium]
MRIAIVGTGVSAMTAAYLLQPHHDITVFDKAGYVGGHTNTLDVELGGQTYAVDTGFIVFNDWTYPNFIKLIDRLGVPSRASTMTFSVACDQTGLEYNGGSITGLFAQKRNLVSPQFLGMLRDILKFNKLAKRFAEQGDDQTVMEGFARQHGLGEMFYDKYLIPIAASIWSADPREVAQFPMRFIAQFFRNHGMLNVWDRPQWRTVVGGSRSYMAELTRPFADRIRLNEAVTAVRRFDDRVELDTEREPGQRFDHVLLGCHSDQALAILGEGATDDERAALGSIPYQPNLAILHTDENVLPSRRACWAAWNYRIPWEGEAPAEPQATSVSRLGRSLALPKSNNKPVVLTYNMNILQGLDTDQTINVTLNDEAAIDPEKVIAKVPYEHPVFLPQRKAAHDLFDKINHHNRTGFCGAYWRFGFHEDGVVSALNAVKPFGVSL